MNLFRTGKTLLGVLLKDWRRYRRALNARDTSYLTLCNRYERLIAAPEGSGYRCNWQYTSILHAPKHLPVLGLKLLRRALADHPVRRREHPEKSSQAPQISFIIGHRGLDRFPHLLATLESIAGQQGVDLECLVIEQDTQAYLPGLLPAWVRYTHTPPPDSGMPYCRAWAFNVGVREARGGMLVLHDNDMLVPADYAASILRHGHQGYEVINLKRFIFFLGQAHSRGSCTGSDELMAQAPESIMQNAEGGGSIAITRQGYERIGGFDEAFVGWGGEDNEFWERAQTLKTWPYGYLPLVHLWHPAQPGKERVDNPTLQRHQDLSRIPAQTRIGRLRNSPTGLLSGPTGWVPAG